MNILVIKQTSLGDVLHSSGHIRTIKENFPSARITLLTATASADIYAHNPHIAQRILYDHAWVKRNWRRRPLRTVGYIRRLIAQLREQQFALAFDLQGLARSVLFLYFARAGKKYVKGNWLGLLRFSNRSLHAMAEMDGVLKRAGLKVSDTGMEIFVAKAERDYVDALLKKINPANKPLLVFSPFSRWASKDWGLQNYLALADALNQPGFAYAIAFTGSRADRAKIEPILAQTYAKLPAHQHPHNLVGELSIPQFAELLRRARLLVCGDSFPMHLCCAQKTPVLALFAPTDERLTGPLGKRHRVLRPPNCNRCDRPNCARACLNRLACDTVLAAARALIR